jgi:hypothetical protein
VFQIRSRHVWSSGVRGGNVRPEDVSLSGRLATRGGIESVACFVSIGWMVTEWSVPLVTSAIDPWRVKAIARQHSGRAERTGSDLPFGAGQQSWLALGRQKQTSRRPEACTNNTPSKMYVKYLKSNPQPIFYCKGRLHASGDSREVLDYGFSEF